MIALMTHLVYQGPEGAQKPVRLRSQETSLDVPLDVLLTECVALRGGGKPARSLQLLFAPDQKQFAELSVDFGHVQGLQQCVAVEFPFCHVAEMLAKLLAAGRGEAFGLVTLYRMTDGGGGGRKKRRPVSVEPAPVAGLQLGAQ